MPKTFWTAARGAATSTVWRVLAALQGRGPEPPIRGVAAPGATPVDAYWGEHLSQDKRFIAAWQSARDLRKRLEVFPLLRDLMGLYGQHQGQTVLDYGCGPGNDLVGFALHTGARRIIGIDVSARALGLAAHRLSLHRVDPARVELIRKSDADPALPLDDACVDHVHCLGVLQHTSEPERILREFHRVMRPGATAAVMVYNADSLWLHVYTAYEKQIVEGLFPGLPARDAFARNTDGVNCPISRCYAPEEFTALCQGLGFDAQYRGGHFSPEELESLNRYGVRAVDDERLAAVHRDFLRALRPGDRGLPAYQGYSCGVGGVYHLIRR